MTRPNKYVAYYRVSTKRQGESGLGLEAQQNTVHGLADRYEGPVIAEFIEVETGKDTSRPKLAEAIRRAKLTNSTLVVAKLDRLARNAAFTMALQESRLPFICCDNEHANELTIGILAVIAQHEAKQISERTKNALAVAKNRGTKLGSAREGHWEGREDRRRAGLEKATPLASEARSAKARDHYCDVLVPEIKRRREEGQTLEEITAWLNEQGFQTRRGNAFSVSTVWRLIDRYLGKDYLGNQQSKVRPVRAARKD